MADIFISYRNGDGEDAANILDSHLTSRFGADHVFRDVHSIPPGVRYDEHLIAEARRCRVLLAVIGPGWAGHPGLRAHADWVRREILEAHEADAIVIPVLKGRDTGRLRAEDLPEELDWLARIQSLRLDIRDSDADLRSIGDWLAEIVPSLRSDAAQGTGDENPAISVRDSQGVHTGSGEQNNYFYGREERRGASRRKRRAGDLRELDERFVPPGAFADASEKLRDCRTVYLQGPPGSGRAATAKILLSRVGREAGEARLEEETIHELLVRRKDDRDELPIELGPIEDGSLVWADLRDPGGWSWDEIRDCLPTIRQEIVARRGYFVAVLPREAARYDDDVRLYFAEIAKPPLADVLHRHLTIEEFTPLEDVRNIAFVTDQRPLHDVPEYVSRLKAARAADPAAGFPAWCESAYQELTGNDRGVLDLMDKQTEARQRALLLAVAMLPGAHADTIEYAAARLLELTHRREPDQGPLKRTPLDTRLGEIDAERSRSGHVTFRVARRDEAIRAYFWTQLAELRDPLCTWVAGVVSSGNLPLAEQEILVENTISICLTDDRSSGYLVKLTADWTGAGASDRMTRAAAAVLRRGLRSPRASQEFRRKSYAWSRDEPLSEQRARVLIGACRDDMAVSHPDAALIRLLHLARRRPGLGAEQAVADLATTEDRSLLRLALERLAGDRHDAVQPAELTIFLYLCDPGLFTGSSPGGHALIEDDGVRAQLIRGWQSAFADGGRGAWEPRAEDWLTAADPGGDTGSDGGAGDGDRGRVSAADGLLSVLAAAAASHVAAAARLYAMSGRRGFGPRLRDRLRHRITAEQLRTTIGLRVRDEPGEASG